MYSVNGMCTAFFAKNPNSCVNYLYTPAIPKLSKKKAGHVIEQVYSRSKQGFCCLLQMHSVEILIGCYLTISHIKADVWMYVNI